MEEEEEASLEEERQLRGQEDSGLRLAQLVADLALVEVREAALGLVETQTRPSLRPRQAVAEEGLGLEVTPSQMQEEEDLALAVPPTRLAVLVLVLLPLLLVAAQ